MNPSYPWIAKGRSTRLRVRLISSHPVPAAWPRKVGSCVLCFQASMSSSVLGWQSRFEIGLCPTTHHLRATEFAGGPRECGWKHGGSGYSAGENLVQLKQKRIHLTPTGLLMEGDYAQNPLPTSPLTKTRTYLWHGFRSSGGNAGCRALGCHRVLLRLAIKRPRPPKASTAKWITVEFNFSRSIWPLSMPRKGRPPFSLGLELRFSYFEETVKFLYQLQ